MPTRRRHALRLATLLTLSVIFCAPQAIGQTLSKNDREVGRIMLRNVKDSIKKNYYDPEFHGVNIDETFKAAEEKINEATSNGQVFGIIAKAVRSLNDSHTSFRPPPRAMRISYDWQIQMIGDHCYIMAVKPGTDAEAKGLKPGDILHVVDGYKLTHENFESFNYLYHALQPQPALSVVVQSPGEQPRKVDFNATTRQGKKVLDLTSAMGGDFYDLIRESQEYDRIYEHRFKSFGDDLYIWKMPQFDMPVLQVNKFIEGAGKYKTLILDLRGNPGGYVDTALQLIGNLFDHDVKVGDRKKRKETKPLLAKTRGHDIFKGELIVLVDNGSTSASEILARVAQIEKRGTVIGDRSGGMVMESRYYPFSIGESSTIFYGASITDADIIMTDGASLEHVGVTPDKVMLPTGADLREQEDPVLSYAASLAGVKLSPKEAGALFPIRWKLKP
ncbi:MAG TPA: S41 family peptidase [Pyrinomonadaceae bacterium]